MPAIALVVIACVGCDSIRDSRQPTTPETMATTFTLDEQIQAVRLLVAWIAEEGSIPNVEAYPDGGNMATVQRIFVTCEFLPGDAVLSEDPRVHRVTLAESAALFEKHNYEDSAYVVIKTSGETKRNTFQVFGSNSFGYRGGHGFDITFELRDRELIGKGGTTWVS